MTGSHADHQTTSTGLPLPVQTFVTRVLRSAALRGDGELEIVTSSAVIRGRPSDANRVSDLWHRTREQIANSRHEDSSRLPDIEGGDFVELEHVRVHPFSSPDSSVEFPDLIVFTRDIVAMRSTVLPQMSN